MYFYSTTPQYKPRWILMILWSLAILSIGVFILVDTHDFAQILARAFGFFQLISGIIGIVVYVKLPKTQPLSKTVLIQAILRTLVGILAVFLPLVIAKVTWIMVLYLLAAQFLVSAVMDFSVAFRVQRTGFPLGVSPAQNYGNAALSFLGALVLFLAPRFIGLFLLNLLAILLILFGTGLLVTFVRLWWFDKKNIVSV